MAHYRFIYILHLCVLQHFSSPVTAVTIKIKDFI